MSYRKSWKQWGIALAIAASSAADPAYASVCTPGPYVDALVFETTLGDFEVELCSFDAPITVGNLLGYVFSGAYKDTGFIHRSDPGFVVQGGGFYADYAGTSPAVGAVATHAPIPLELANLSNLRGTLAMARTDVLDSATSQWFVNLADSNAFLDTHLGGYAVFGEVVTGMETIDLIEEQDVWPFASPFSQLPLIDYPGFTVSPFPYFVTVSDIRYVPEPSAGLQLGLGGLALAALSRFRNRG